ncbi:MAG: OmpA family protein [Pseudomonadota bacterium]
MNKTLLSTAAIAALIVAAPASAQILGGGGPGGGGLGGSIGGTLGGTIDRGRTTIDTTTRVRESTRIDRELPTRRNRRGVASTVAGDAAIDSATRLGERRIVTRQSAAAEARLSLDQRMLRTRGVAAASRRGLRRVSATASGVQVFVPRVALPAPALPRVAVHAYPAYSSSYYYDPGAVFVGSAYVDTYMDRQHQDLEAALRGTGATVERRGDDLIVMLPGDVTFAFDKADIRPRFYGVLSAFAQTMRNYPGTDVEVIGHTDAVGSDAYNLGLSERRGRSVAEFLVAQDAEPSRLVVEAMGEAEPVASNATVDGRAANRRVELIVHPRAG